MRKKELQAKLNVMSLERLSDFSVIIEKTAGGEALAIEESNALWIFSLLSLACRSPVIPLYSLPEGSDNFTLANRNAIIFCLPNIVAIPRERLLWARQHFTNFICLLKNDRFRSAQRYYNNSHHLPDDDARIMLLWAGIEGLLDVETELRRRIALHAAILYDGDAAAKAAHFANVKKAYDVRSKVIHGAGADAESLRLAYQFASSVLIGLLSKVAELGRVPPASELDKLAASVSIFC